MDSGLWIEKSRSLSRAQSVAMATSLALLRDDKMMWKAFSARLKRRPAMNRTVQKLMLRCINIWPPFLGAGIRVRWRSNRAVDVEMRLRPWNRNYVGTHYGGSLYSMTDPFYMLMLMENLGRDYIVWDKAASIRFRKPGKGKVKAEFRLTDAQLDDIREKLTTLEKYEPTFLVEVKDEAGEVVAEMQKVIHIRRKKPAIADTSPEKAG